MIKRNTTIFAMILLILVIAACGPAVKNVKTPDVSEVLETVSAMPSVSTEDVDALIAMVNDFVTSGEITGQAENGLLAKLETIKQKVMSGELNPAANEMNAFINEVRAQLGKKITETAANALIARAEQVVAAFMAGIPVTGEGTKVPTATIKPTDDGIPTVTPKATDMATSTTPKPTDATTGLIKPTPMGDPLEHQVQWDLIALQVAEAVGFSTFDYDLFKLPAGTTWEVTLTHYETETAAAGWGDAPTEMNEIAAVGNYAVWSVTGSDGKTNYFVVAQVDAADGSYTINIFGTK